MPESFPLSHLDRPSEQIEGFYDQKEIFAFVKDLQAELDLKRFDTYSEATAAAEELVRDLDNAAKEEGLIHKVATLLGPHVAMPTTEYHGSGGVNLVMQDAYDGSNGPRDVTGPFNGFCSYAIGEPWSGRYRPVLGYSVLVRRLFVPGFDGNLTAYGPVDSTFVDFLDDEIKRELGQ